MQEQATAGAHKTGPDFASPTRQKADVLFSTDEALPSGTRTLRIQRVGGYSEIELLGVASGIFTASIQEACESDGPFVQSQIITSTASGLDQRICERITPCGEFMRIVIAGAPLTALEFCGRGLPVA